MGYTFICDGPCGEGYNTFPPFAGEFTEEFLKTRGGKFALDYKPGQKVTLCADCMELMVLAGKIAVCRMCGHAQEIKDLNEHEPDCPACEDGELYLQERHQEDP